jgi:hypothetical protein
VVRLILMIISSLLSVGCSPGTRGSGTEVGKNTSPAEDRVIMEPDNSQQLHVFVSNQSAAMPVIDVEITVGERQVFHQELATGSQHSWKELTIALAPGKHSLAVSESKTQHRQTKTIIVERELWVVITFHAPPARFDTEVFDHPVGLM